MQPAKSIQLHSLHGTKPGAKNPATESGIAAGRPRFPKELPVELRSIFKRICKMLAERRALTEADEPLLTLFCVAHDRARRANLKLEEEGEVRLYVRLDNNGVAHEMEKPNYWLKVAQDAEKLKLACLDRLGLSPLNRDKVKPTASSEVEKLDPMEAFMARRPTVLNFSKPEKVTDEQLTSDGSNDPVADEKD